MSPSRIHFDDPAAGKGHGDRADHQPFGQGQIGLALLVCTAAPTDLLTAAATRSLATAAVGDAEEDQGGRQGAAAHASQADDDADGEGDGKQAVGCRR